MLTSTHSHSTTAGPAGIAEPYRVDICIINVIYMAQIRIDAANAPKKYTRTAGLNVIRRRIGSQ